MTCWFVLAGAEICALAGRLRHQRPSASLTAGHLSRLARTYHGLSTPEPGLTGHNLSIIRDKSYVPQVGGRLWLIFWPVFGAGGDAEGEFLDGGEGVAEVAEVAGVGEPGLVAGGLVGGEVDGDGLAVAFAGPLVVGAVQGRGVGGAAAAGLAAAGAAFQQGAGKGESG